jgi:hypothetical protein
MENGTALSSDRLLALLREVRKPDPELAEIVDKLVPRPADIYTPIRSNFWFAMRSVRALSVAKCRRQKVLWHGLRASCPLFAVLETQK